MYKPWNKIVNPTTYVTHVIIYIGNRAYELNAESCRICTSKEAMKKLIQIQLSNYPAMYKLFTHSLSLFNMWHKFSPHVVELFWSHPLAQKVAQQDDWSNCHGKS
ncbi:hypothetical protein ACJX0J_036004 [Zea mays]